MTLSSRMIQVKGRSTEALTAGQQEPLVFLHGGGIVEGFDPFAPLAERFTVTAPLMPGYGATELDPPLVGREQVVENIRDVLDELGIRQTVLVGHSLGGWRAAAFAARFPERVTELVLAAPFGMDVPEHPLPDMMAMSPAERLAALTNDPSIWEGRLPTGPDPEFEAARGREGQSIMRFHPGPHDPDLPGLLSSVSAPTLLLWGEDDKTIPAGHADAWHKALPHSSVKTFPATGHLLFHERSEAIAAITDFVRASRA
ncbi:alpha/beta hydrolase [Streptomyces prunicolor]|uniref:alpha/beta fold hydrolase n=1 Tax=Streptomyces prunicolor TaxID=67348 RepID=UPI003869FA5E|nr:alpha/beta hydrolase [Streptomyces prunicolor]